MKIRINRLAIAAAALACLAIAGYGFLQAPPEEESPLWVGAFVRVGITLAAVWIASARWLGAKGSVELSPTALVAIVAVLAAFALRPRIAAPAVIVIGILWFVVRPKKSLSRFDRSKRRDKS